MKVTPASASRLNIGVWAIFSAVMLSASPPGSQASVTSSGSPVRRSRRAASTYNVAPASPVFSVMFNGAVRKPNSKTSTSDSNWI